jgi:hypothetical protein
MTTDLTGSGPADSPHDGGLTGRFPVVRQLTDAEWRDLKEFEDAQRTYPVLQDDDEDQQQWQPPVDLPAGTSWLGVTEDGQPLLVRSWVCDGERQDGPALVPNVWVIGRTGSGKSATVRALLGPDLAARREVLLPIDGTGAMSLALAGFALTGAVARTAQEWLDAVTLAHAIMRARQARLATANPWRRPSPSDPIVTLLVQGCWWADTGLPAVAAQMVCEITRLGRDLGVRVAQIAPSPLAEHLIGGSDFRSQCRVVLGHAVTDPFHDRISAQGAGVDGVSLLGLPTGHVVVVVDGAAVRGQVAMVPEQTREAGADRAVLDPGDLTDDVRHALDVCSDPWWGTHPDPEVITDPEKITTVDGLRAVAQRMQELVDGALAATAQQAAGDLAEARRIAVGISGEGPQTSLCNEDDLPEFFPVCGVTSIAADVAAALDLQRLDLQRLDGTGQLKDVQGLIRDLLQEIDAAETSMLEEQAYYADDEEDDEADGEEAAPEAGDAPALDEVPVAACDGASAGVMISDLEGRWLMFERVKFPPGVAPVAGHVWDEHAGPGADPDEAYEAAARAEVAEEVGLAVVSLVDTGIGGWRPNRCRRPAGPAGTGHQWRIYRATVTGELAPSPTETRHPRWLTRAHLQQLAQVTVAYARGALDQEDWAARPGIEPVWVQWLVQLGLVDVHPGDLVLVDRLAAGGPDGQVAR